MAKIHQPDKSQTLAIFLKRINRGEDPTLLRKEAYELLTDIRPDDITLAEQNLIDDGYSIQIVQLLSATFMLMGITENSSDNPKTWLPASHILRKVMVEHDLIRCFLADLNLVVSDIQHLDHITDVNSEFRKLTHITEHLHAMREHFDREDDVIFPYLKKYGRISLCQVAEGDHINIETEINNLDELIGALKQISLIEFSTTLTSIAGHLSTITMEHLAQEDILLYPIALGMIDDNKIWKQIKILCEDIGYCGVHL